MKLRRVITRTDLAHRLALVALLVGSLVAGWPAQAATAEGALPRAGAGGPPPGLSDQAWDGILAQIQPAGAPIVPNQVQKLTADDGAANDYFGFSAAVSENIAVVGAWGDNSNRGAAYIFYRNLSAGDTWVQLKKLSGGAAGDYFGWSVAIDGDTIVVGAPKCTVGSNSEEGTTYVYTRNQGGADVWGLVQTLTVEGGGAANDHFGYSVSISGDTSVVGAPDSDGLSTNQGAAYIFARNQAGIADGWGQVRKLTGGSMDYGYFGQSVAIDGGTVAVGMPGDDAGLGHAGQGAAFIFARNKDGADAWRQVAKLTSADGAAGDSFGKSVALNGEIAVVGAPDGNADTGSAYVFGRNRTGADAWGEIKKLTAGDGAAGDRFGESVAASIDGNTVVVGARNADIGTGSNQGAAYLFARNQSGSNQWGQLSKLVAAGGVAGDLFGVSVAVSGNVLVVGALGYLTSTGAAYVFAGTGNWMQTRQRVADDGTASDYFGTAVALSGNTLVVGAHYSGDGGRGAAYVFARNHGGADAWGQVAKLNADDGLPNDHFGSSVAIAGDTIVVGAPRHAVEGEAAQGAAYVFARNRDETPPDGTADAWGQVAELNAVDGMANDELGTSVDIDGDTVVVGAPNHDFGSNANQGVAYTFARNQGGADVWGEVTGMLAADGAAGDKFGSAVAIAGDTVVVGAPDHTVSGEAQGAAYVFTRNKNGTDHWDEVTGLTAAGIANFGNAVAIAGDTIVVGTLGFVDSTVEVGTAHVFARNRGGLDAWGQVTRLIPLDEAAACHFAEGVAIDGDTIAVGAECDASQGAVYVFARDRGGVYHWGQAQKLIAADGVDSDEFGHAMAVSGNTLLVGAPGRAVGSNNRQGAAYVFVPSLNVNLPIILR